MESRPTALTYRSDQTLDPRLVRMGQLKYVRAQAPEKGVLYLGTPEEPLEEPQEIYAEYTVKARPRSGQKSRPSASSPMPMTAWDGWPSGRCTPTRPRARPPGCCKPNAPGGHGEGSTTSLVCALTQGGRETIYRYDAVGNLVEEADRGQLTLPDGAGGQMPLTSWEGEVPLTLSPDQVLAKRTYAYAPLGQLIRADSLEQETTWTYRYDQGGNLLEKQRYAYTTAALDSLTPEETIAYSYGDAGWKDKLTAYDGKPITYDTIGNPLSFDGWSYTWKAGRMLARMRKGSVDAKFTYDHTGLRVKKEVDGVETLYTLNGKKITHLRKGNTQIHFYYDAQGRASILRYNGVDYAYRHNLQGDVTGLVDMAGETVVEYSYDPWGRPVGTTGGMASTLGYDNPFRYRGYVWDEETGLYYLRSRYYSPEWGRFLNADELLGVGTGLLTHNPYAYCKNKAVNFADSNGMVLWEVAASFGATILYLSSKGQTSPLVQSREGPALNERNPGKHHPTEQYDKLPVSILVEGALQMVREGWKYPTKDQFFNNAIACTWGLVDCISVQRFI